MCILPVPPRAASGVASIHHPNKFTNFPRPSELNAASSSLPRGRRSALSSMS
jgi:hypothetical protein